MGKNLVKVTGFRISDQTILEKLKIIAKNHKRDRNKEVEWALKLYVDAYEAKHGKIQLHEEKENS